MRSLRIAAAAVLIALSLGGCATQFGQTVGKAWDVATSASVSPTAVIVAANSFNLLEVTATNYLRLKKCSVTSGPVCRDPTATKAIIPAVRSGRMARNNLEQFLKTHPGQLGPTGLYDALKTSIGTLQSIFTQYNVGAAT